MKSHYLDHLVILAVTEETFPQEEMPEMLAKKQSQ